MESIKEIFRIGKGPSSSHTMGPQRAAKVFAKRYPKASRFEVTLYGSLATTGKGHDENDNATTPWIVYSIGGGALSEGKGSKDPFLTPQIYPLSTISEIKKWCERTGCTYWEYVEQCEGPKIWDYLTEVWKAMQDSIERGIDTEGRLPGPLNLQRKASNYYIRATSYRSSIQSRSLVYAYTLAVSEENAAGGTIVTAPTCGACGVVPGVLYFLAKHHGFNDEKILHALATAGLFGNVVKQNASISGADVAQINLLIQARQHSPFILKRQYLWQTTIIEVLVQMSPHFASLNRVILPMLPKHHLLRCQIFLE